MRLVQSTRNPPMFQIWRHLKLECTSLCYFPIEDAESSEYNPVGAELQWLPHGVAVFTQKEYPILCLINFYLFVSFLIAAGVSVHSIKSELRNVFWKFHNWPLHEQIQPITEIQWHLIVGGFKANPDYHPIWSPRVWLRKDKWSIWLLIVQCLFFIDIIRSEQHLPLVTDSGTSPRHHQPLSFVTKHVFGLSLINLQPKKFLYPKARTLLDS